MRRNRKIIIVGMKTAAETAIAALGAKWEVR